MNGIWIHSYNGRVKTNFLISDFAVAIIFEFFIPSGALFQSLVASPIQELIMRVDEPSSINLPFVTLLVVLESIGVSCFIILIGNFGTFIAFYISDSLIWAATWFTDNICWLFNKVAVEVLVENLPTTKLTLEKSLVNSPGWAKYHYRGVPWLPFQKFNRILVWHFYLPKLETVK